MDARSGQGELRTKAIDAEAAFLSANKSSLKRPLEANTQALPQKRVLPPGFGSTPSYPTTSSYSSSSYKSHSSAYKAASSSKSGKTEFRFDDPVSKALSTSSLRATAATKPLGKRSNPTDPSTTSNSSSTAPFKVASEPGITLTNEQSRVLDLVANGENLFYTGSAGTGKSVLMRQIINGLRTRMTRDQIAITAPTGIAATNIGGVTLHSFAGCGLAIGVFFSPKVLSPKAKFYRRRRCISDPFSETILPQAVNVFLIVCGDFMQLPPVNKREVKFAFEADGWKECMTKTIMLKEVFRQKDAEFIKILNEIRMGEVSLQTEETLKKLSRPLSNLGGLVPTELLSFYLF
ncbi:P-loop containing nucleoside triphosphate hydrolase protein [Obelidium mucronatum]|nr:P-loop containing nucleoside triphosphate hydrolase protein [Obelidium mucronatum]